MPLDSKLSYDENYFLDAWSGFPAQLFGSRAWRPVNSRPSGFLAPVHRALGGRKGGLSAGRFLWVETGGKRVLGALCHTGAP